MRLARDNIKMSSNNSRMVCQPARDDHVQKRPWLCHPAGQNIPP